MLLKRGLEIGSENMIKLVALIWEVANGKMLVLLFRCCQIIKSNSSVKLTRSNLFRIQLTEKK